MLARAPLGVGPVMLLAPSPEASHLLDLSIAESHPALMRAVFPDPTNGPLLVVYQGANGLVGLRWRLDPAVLSAARAAFGRDGEPALVLRLRRLNQPKPAATLHLADNLLDAAADAGLPPGSGPLEAEIGWLDSHGGWLLVARSNRLDLPEAVGVGFLRGSGEQPAVAPPPGVINARTGFGWAPVIAADARAKAPPPAPKVLAGQPTPTALTAQPAAPLPPTPVVAGPPPGPFPLWRPGAAPAGWRGVLPPTGVDALLPASQLPEVLGRAAAPVETGPDGGTPAPGSEGADSVARGPLSNPDIGGPATTGGAAAEGGHPLRSREPSPSAPLATRGLLLPERSLAADPLTEAAGVEVPGKPPDTLVDPMARLVPGEAIPAAPLPTRGLLLPERAASPAEVPAPADAPAPIAGSGPVVRPGADTATALHAELVVYGSAAPNTVLDLGGHPYEVGAGGRFVLRLPIDDRELILALLQRQPTLLVNRRADAPDPDAEGV